MSVIIPESRVTVDVVPPHVFIDHSELDPTLTFQREYYNNAFYIDPKWPSAFNNYSEWENNDDYSLWNDGMSLYGMYGPSGQIKGGRGTIQQAYEAEKSKKMWMTVFWVVVAVIVAAIAAKLLMKK
jgi:hypothetical protein